MSSVRGIREIAWNSSVICTSQIQFLCSFLPLNDIEFSGCLVSICLIKSYRTVVERSTVRIDTVLSYCRCCLHDTELLDYKEFFKVKNLYQ